MERRSTTAQPETVVPRYFPQIFQNSENLKQKNLISKSVKCLHNMLPIDRDGHRYMKLVGVTVTFQN